LQQLARHSASLRIQALEIWPIGNQAALLRKIRKNADRRQAVAHRQISQDLPLYANSGEESINTPLASDFTIAWLNGERWNDLPSVVVKPLGKE
jgi:hypothetical protein